MLVMLLYLDAHTTIVYNYWRFASTFILAIPLVSLSSAAASAKFLHISGKRLILGTLLKLLLHIGCCHGVEGTILLELFKVEVEKTFTISYNSSTL